MCQILQSVFTVSLIGVSGKHCRIDIALMYHPQCHEIVTGGVSHNDDLVRTQGLHESLRVTQCELHIFGGPEIERKSLADPDQIRDSRVLIG